MYFTTTRLHQELAGGKFVISSLMRRMIRKVSFRSKAMWDLNKLEALVKNTAQKIPYVCIATSVNMAGAAHQYGQSKKLRAYTKNTAYASSTI